MREKKPKQRSDRVLVILRGHETRVRKVKRESGRVRGTHLEVERKGKTKRPRASRDREIGTKTRKARQKKGPDHEISRVRMIEVRIRERNPELKTARGLGKKRGSRPKKKKKTGKRTRSESL